MKLSEDCHHLLNTDRLTEEKKKKKILSGRHVLTLCMLKGHDLNIPSATFV